MAIVAMTHRAQPVLSVKGTAENGGTITLYRDACYGARARYTVDKFWLEGRNGCGKIVFRHATQAHAKADTWLADLRGYIAEGSAVQIGG